MFKVQRSRFQVQGFRLLLLCLLPLAFSLSAKAATGTGPVGKSSIQLLNYPLTNGYVPPHGGTFNRFAPIPPFIISDYLLTPSLSYSQDTNLMNQFVTSGVASAWSKSGVYLEVDLGWEATNVLRHVGDGGISYNPYNYPGGIAQLTASTHSNNIGVLLYTYYSQLSCAGGGYAGQYMGSPPGFLYGDIGTMALWGVDGINVDSCNIPADGTADGAQSLRSLYAECDAGVQDAVSGYVNSLYARPLITRLANSSPAIANYTYATQHPWTPYECNIQFDAGAFVQTSLISDLKNWFALQTKAFSTGPGHYYAIGNMLDGAFSTNTVCNSLGLMAVFSTPMLFTGVSGPNIKYYTNADVIGIYQDAAVNPPVLVTNNSTFTAFAKRLSTTTAGSTRFAVAVVNTNTTAQNCTLSFGSLGLTTALSPVNVYDCWYKTNGLLNTALVTSVATNTVSLFIFTQGNTNGVASGANDVPAAVTVGGSPFNFTNTTPMTLECSVTGAAAYSVKKNGVSIGGSLTVDNYVKLSPGSYLTLTYVSTAPTMTTNSW